MIFNILITALIEMTQLFNYSANIQFPSLDKAEPNSYTEFRSVHTV